jgi:hypothetical protein
MKNLPERRSNFLLYSSSDGDIKIDVRLEDETVWLTQKLIAELYQTTPQNITIHLKNIYESGELEEKATCKDFLQVQIEGNRQIKRKQKFYNLDAIISVGYRVNSYQATQFRIWATKTLKEFIIKGFVLNDERLKQGGQVFGKDYFDELLERIREIRASDLSVDYDKNSPLTKEFFATVQNKLHWAITGKTAAEIIYSSTDAKKIFMGLKTWKNVPDGKILKSDVSIAKNYLYEKHIKELERIISAYLDLAENRAEKHILMKMTDWIEFLNKFLELSNYPILTDAGKIGKLEAKLKAEQEYETYRKMQDKGYISDFDREIKRISKKNTQNEKNKGKNL